MIIFCMFFLHNYCTKAATNDSVGVIHDPVRQSAIVWRCRPFA